jgi:hypothetical protein
LWTQEVSSKSTLVIYAEGRKHSLQAVIREACDPPVKTLGVAKAVLITLECGGGETVIRQNLPHSEEEETSLSHPYQTDGRRNWQTLPV